MRVRPNGQRVLVENVAAETQMAGLHIPEQARETRPAEAVVVAVGSRVEIDVGGRNLATGDRVLTNRYEGQPIKVKGRMMRMLVPGDILAVVTS